jgi:ABC-2 type transport system permease protein
LQAFLRVRSEEANGQLESVLSTATGRTGWLLSHVLCVVGGVVMLALVAGLATGLAYLLVSGANWSEVLRLIAATLVQVPAVLVLVGFSIAIFGWLPRAVIAATWGVFVFCVLLLELGSLLKLPQWTQDISPFAHVPAAPAEAVTATPLLALCAVATLLGTVGFMFFRRRDVVAS